MPLLANRTPFNAPPIRTEHTVARVAKQSWVASLVASCSRRPLTTFTLVYDKPLWAHVSTQSRATRPLVSPPRAPRTALDIQASTRT